MDATTSSLLPPHPHPLTSPTTRNFPTSNSHTLNSSNMPASTFSTPPPHIFHCSHPYLQPAMNIDSLCSLAIRTRIDIEIQARCESENDMLSRFVFVLSKRIYQASKQQYRQAGAMASKHFPLKEEPSSEDQPTHHTTPHTHTSSRSTTTNKKHHTDTDTEKQNTDRQTQANTETARRTDRRKDKLKKQSTKLRKHMGSFLKNLR